MPVTVSGSIGLAVKNLKDAIAATSWFQTWTGTANATDAGARIGFGGRDANESDPTPINGTRPWLLIYPEPGWSSRLVAINTPLYSPAVIVEAESSVTAGYAASSDQAQQEAATDWGGLLGTIAGLSGTTINSIVLMLKSVAETLPPTLQGDDERTAGGGRWVKWTAMARVEMGI